jgi:uncharacterized damage-inducible protein DinB
MALVDGLLAEYDREMHTTRRVLERAPERDFAWQPHAKSFTLGQLATHLATIPHWGVAVLTEPGFDLAAGGGQPAPLLATTAELLATFDRHVAATRAALADRTDADLLAPWTLRRGDQVVFTLPRAGVLRSFILSHMIHHRGQLSVYLRLRDVPVPSIYGPSADEAAF